jgi:hypothetical protein
MPDSVLICAGPGGHQKLHAAALASGLRVHGVNVGFHRGFSLPTGRTVACWGWRMGLRLRERGCDVLVMERGYIGDRFAWTSLAWNGLNGHAEPMAVPNDPSRFEAHHGQLLKPWSPAGSYTLIVGQVKGDMSLQGRDLGGWYADQAKVQPGPHVFRPHPEALKRGHRECVPAGVAVDRGDLASAIAGARLVVTYNSNTGVESVLAGKPTLVEDPGSMAWPVRGTGEPDRLTWASALAWRQWTIDEIADGTAWAHVGAGR